MQTSGQESPATRKRAAETDLRHLEEGAAETDVRQPEAERFEFDKRTALKRKAEGDPSDSEMKDSAIDSLAELWHKEDDHGDEVDLFFLQQRERSIARVHQSGSDWPVCEEPKTPFPHDECGWDYSDDSSFPETFTYLHSCLGE